MKKFYKVLLIAVIIAAITAGFSIKSFANENTFDTKVLSNELTDTLQNWIVDSYSQYYKNINVNLSLEPNSVTVKNGTVSAVFDTKIDLTLKAEKIEDLPFMKGMLKYYNSKKLASSKAQVEAANNLINDWKSELKDYIGKPEPTAYAEFKITANVKNDGTLEKNSLKLYINESPSTNKGDDFYPVPSPMLETSEKMEKSGAEQMKETLQKALNSQIKTKSSFPYNRIAARDYANKYTSNASSTDQIVYDYKDKYGTWHIGAIERYVDPTYWNNYFYPLPKYSNGHYTSLAANNCADYVSQALHAGGILIDPGQWERLKDKNGYYPWAWTYVPSLKGYMTNKGYWTPWNFTYANAGCVIRMPEYDYHTVMIVLNDTIHRQFSGHTRDRKQLPYYSSNGWEYYKVQKP